MTAKNDSRTIIYVVIGVLVVAVLIVAGLIGETISVMRHRSDVHVGNGYATTIQGAVVVAGKGAATTVDVYEDFPCPRCGRFEANLGAGMNEAISRGKIQVRYHMVAFLDPGSSPPGYSPRAANAVLCAAEADIFAAYHKRLFADQSAEGAEGLTDQQWLGHHPLSESFSPSATLS